MLRRSVRRSVSHSPFHLNDFDIGSQFANRGFNSGLERLGRCRAAVATTGQPQPHRVGGNRQKFHVPAVGLQIRANLGDGLLHARFEIDRVQIVQQQQIPEQVVIQATRENRLSGFS